MSPNLETIFFTITWLLTKVYIISVLETEEIQAKKSQCEH